MARTIITALITLWAVYTVWSSYVLFITRNRPITVTIAGQSREDNQWYGLAIDKDGDVHCRGGQK